MRVTTRDGGRVAVREPHALGTPQRPAPARHVSGKFTANAEPRIGQRAAAELLDRLTRLDEVADAADLLRLTRPGENAS